VKKKKLSNSKASHLEVDPTTRASLENMTVTKVTTTKTGKIITIENRIKPHEQCKTLEDALKIIKMGVMGEPVDDNLLKAAELLLKANARMEEKKVVDVRKILNAIKKGSGNKDEEIRKLRIEMGLPELIPGKTEDT
jgi:hypothetical protein